MLKKLISSIAFFALTITSIFACGECWNNDTINHSHWFDKDGNLHLLCDEEVYDDTIKDWVIITREHKAEYWVRDERNSNMIWCGFSYVDEDNYGAYKAYDIYYIWEGEGIQFTDNHRNYETKNTYFVRISYGAYKKDVEEEELGWQELFNQDGEWKKAVNAYSNSCCIPHNLNSFF